MFGQGRAVKRKSFSFPWLRLDKAFESRRHLERIYAVISTVGTKCIGDNSFLPKRRLATILEAQVLIENWRKDYNQGVS